MIEDFQQMRLFNLKHPKQPPLLVSWLFFIMWTLLVCYLLLWPSEGTTVGRVSGFFGGSELTDAMGHIVLVFIEAALIHNVLRYYISLHRSLRYGVAGVLIFAIILEFVQIWIPSRGASLMDLGANTSGVCLYLVLMIWVRNIKEKTTDDIF